MLKSTLFYKRFHIKNQAKETLRSNQDAFEIFVVWDIGV